jgi:hypothetical protein
LRAAAGRVFQEAAQLPEAGIRQPAARRHAAWVASTPLFLSATPTAGCCSCSGASAAWNGPT